MEGCSGRDRVGQMKAVKGGAWEQWDQRHGSCQSLAQCVHHREKGSSPTPRPSPGGRGTEATLETQAQLWARTYISLILK